MATHADISGNLTIAALQSVRRNAANTGFETYLVGSGESGNSEIVTNIVLQNLTDDISTTEIDGTDVAGLYRICFYMRVTANDPTSLGTVIFDCGWTDEVAYTSQEITGSRVITLSVANDVNSNSWVVYNASGKMSYYTWHTGDYGDAVYSLRVCVERLFVGAVSLSGIITGSTTIGGALGDAGAARATAMGTAIASATLTG